MSQGRFGGRLASGTRRSSRRVTRLRLEHLEPRTMLSVVSSAPPLDTTIEGINIDEAGGSIPPDPSGAAGPNHVVSVVNTAIEWHTKAGVQQNSQRLDGANGFFASLNPSNFVYDPKVTYDQYADRFVVVALDLVEIAPNDAGNVSRILLAASDDSDPNGVWHFQAIDSKTIIANNDYWADYPGFAVDDEAIYITANMFRFAAGGNGPSLLWIVDKATLYAGGTAAVNRFDPSAAAGQGGGFTLQPAHVYGAAPAGLGTFLVSNFGFGSGNDSLSVIRIDNPLAGATFTNQFIDVGDIHSGAFFLGAPQMDSADLIDIVDNRMMNAVWRNNQLYAVNTVIPPTGPDAGTATAHWYRIDTTNLNALALADQGDIGGEDIAVGTNTFVPSVAVDSGDNLAIGFAASGPNIHPGAYYTGRLASDPAGTVESSGTLAAGVDVYEGGFVNRWGDYTGTAVDPANDATFWLFNEYASTPDGFGFGRWATRWGSFTHPTTPGLTIGDVTAEEPATGSISFTFGLSLDRPPKFPVSVDFATVDGTASVLSGDYLSAVGTVTFAIGQQSQTVSVPVFADLLREPAETFTVVLSNPVNAEIRDGVGLGTILNHRYAPVAVDDEITVPEDAALVRIGILSNDSDLDGRLIPASVVFSSQPGLGTISYNSATGVILYTATPNMVGPDSIRYHVSDDEGTVSNEATVTITIQGFNDPPVTTDDLARTDINLPVNIDVLSNDHDVDGLLARNSLGVALAPQHGSLTVEANGTFTYTPAQNYSGGDTFMYAVQDNGGARAMGTVAVRVGNPVTIGGAVYADINNNGIKDANEIGIPNVNVTLIKNDAPFVTMNVVTGVDGSYLFTDSGGNLLPGGLYSIVETHPGFFADGKDTAGTPVPALVLDDKFVNLAVPSGGAATNFNFGERGLRVEFINAYLDRRAFYASSMNSLAGINLQLGDVWFAFDNGIAGKLAANSSFDGSQGGAAITLYDQNLRPLARSNSNNSGTQVAFAGSAEGRYFLKLSGTNPQVDFDAIVTSDAQPKPSWQNATNPLDANDDHFVTPNDALIVINALNSLGAGDLASRHVPTTLLVDTNGDGTVSPLDVLLVINHLNSISPNGADAPIPRAASGSAGASGDSPAAMSGAIDQALGSLAAGDLSSAAVNPDLYDTPLPWSKPLAGRGRKPAAVNV